MAISPLAARAYSLNTPLQKRLVSLVVAVASTAMLLSFTVVYFLMQGLLY